MATRVVVTGAAGLVGQNLLARLQDARESWSITAIDKHSANTATLRRLHPSLRVIEADMAARGAWQDAISQAELVVSGHAQIGGLDETQFQRNNELATELMLDACSASQPYVVQMSSSVVNSKAVDFYTESKKAQEQLVVESGLAHCVLRPTLMFGWFDRKHLGWLARFIKKAPVCPSPGHGRYMRQPLYVQDFCAIVESCMRNRPANLAYNISGLERIDYIDLIRQLKTAVGATTPIVKLPYSAFKLMLRLYALFDRDPPFTVKQLEALVTPDEFEVIDWPGLFGVEPTRLADALQETFNHPTYSTVELDF